MPSTSPSRLTQRSAPNSPRRHIHSSFPYYFYSTPSSPDSESLSAFVASCESRLSELGARTTSVSNLESKDDHEFRFQVQPVTFSCRPVALASADSLFCNGRMIPSEPLTPSPLKLPPRLQFIKNIRKSLRSTQSLRHGRSPTKLALEFKTSKRFDPFTAAMKTVTKEDARWCQISKQHRRAKSYDHTWLGSDPMWPPGDSNTAQAAKVEGEANTESDKFKESHHKPTKLDPILEGSTSGKSATTSSESERNERGKSRESWKNLSRRVKIIDYIKGLFNGKERTENKISSQRLIRKEPVVRTLAKYQLHHNQQSLLACFGWGTS